MNALVPFLIANWSWIGPVAGVVGSLGLSAAHARGYQLPILSSLFSLIHNSSPSDGTTLVNTLGGMVNSNLDPATIVSATLKLLAGATADTTPALPDLQAAASHPDPAMAVQLLGGVLSRLGQRRQARRAVAVPAKAA